ncbi:hypothetical protein PF005_g1362 [Phytophthora fragariae]|uniref:Uncharacterized protein n=1 Tax=Phytophthora fragariae TaxID=53985 RepID=A0A6A4AGL2_9STRA|nr:hypothetical protein PF003_g20890 [Phytophthora fragariae]KAE8949034.1 hypothetical protein PF009_g1398 [Phytophthora fragariae]KAE9029879.1 hypothetical protein PF011_g867 [Phytophthora fragariae]KAE9138007.1 hypothetical protein PF010_g1094 [Phytophthora fragariae]KAE9138511.1 hypothetical protein PF007_g1363 [Phytophthora fragariae]
METFRSPRVLEEVVQVEKNHPSVLPQQRPPMGPEEAFNKLRQAVLTIAHTDKSADFGAHELLAGLEAACWQSFVPGDNKAGGCKNPNHDDKERQQPRILYSQLLRGTEAMLREEEAACQQLRDQIEQVEGRNNDLPRMIQECQAAVARAMESAVHGSPVLERRRSSPDEVDVSARTATIREGKAEMRRRKDLRLWACNDLRAGLNDLYTRRSELKQLVSVTTGDVKREEQANKLRAKRLEGLRTLSTTTNLLPTGRVGSKTSTQQQLARLTLALAKNQVLQEVQRDRKAYVRARTEAIFDVRCQLRELNNERVAVEKDLKDLEEEAAHLKRAFTPRPDWGNLHDATVVTTAVDRVDAAARMRMGATRNKLSGGKAADLDEDRASEQRVMHILSSSWSTVAKVGAMAAELAKIRSRDHAGDTILAEQKKLKHLHKEIARLLQQLEAVKAQSAA